MMRERFLLAFLTCVLITAAALPHAEAHSGVSFSAYTATPPTIDGNIQAGEWAAAATRAFGPFGPGNAYSGTLYMMNDGANLYIAVSIAGDGTLGGVTLDSVSVLFDNDHDGVLEQGDDCVDVNCLVGPNFGDEFYDAISILLRPDSGSGGTVDGQGTVSRQGLLNHFELRHPLDSADDAHDFSLSLGQTVGFALAVGVDNVVYLLWPYGLGNYLFPTTYANYVVASAPSPAPTPVGGMALPVNKFYILAPYLALIGFVGAVTAAVAVIRRRKP